MHPVSLHRAKAAGVTAAFSRQKTRQGTRQVPRPKDREQAHWRSQPSVCAKPCRVSSLYSSIRSSTCGAPWLHRQDPVQHRQDAETSMTCAALPPMRTLT